MLELMNSIRASNIRSTPIRWRCKSVATIDFQGYGVPLSPNSELHAPCDVSQEVRKTRASWGVSPIARGAFDFRYCTRRGYDGIDTPAECQFAQNCNWAARCRMSLSETARLAQRGGLARSDAHWWPKWMSSRHSDVRYGFSHFTIGLTLCDASARHYGFRRHNRSCRPISGQQAAPGTPWVCS